MAFKEKAKHLLILSKPIMKLIDKGLHYKFEIKLPSPSFLRNSGTKKF